MGFYVRDVEAEDLERRWQDNATTMWGLMSLPNSVRFRVRANCGYLCSCMRLLYRLSSSHKNIDIYI